VGKAAVLRKSLEAKSKEAAALTAEVQRVRLEAQMMRMQLLAQGVKDESTIPANLRAGGSPEEPGLKFLEQRRLLEWLAEVCDLTSRKTCNVVGDLYVAGYKAVIGHGVQWPLSVPDGLSLTIPIELESAIVGMLSKARRSLLSLDDFERFATEWDMLSVEMCVEGDTMPGLFLVRREDAAAIVVSAWPKLPPSIGAGASSSCHSFDAGKFFEGMSDMKPDTAKAVFFGHDGLANSLSFSRSGAVQWDREGSGSQQMHELGIDFHVCEPPEYEHFSLTGPFGRVTIADPLPGAAQREIVEEIVSLSLEHGLQVHHALSPSSTTPQESTTSSVLAVASEGHLDDGRPSCRFGAGPLLVAVTEHVESPQPPPVSKGDSVEVQYQGKWFSGVLQGVQGEFALVSCDVDDPDIITVAPLRKVRAASYDETARGTTE